MDQPVPGFEDALRGQIGLEEGGLPDVHGAPGGREVLGHDGNVSCRLKIQKRQKILGAATLGRMTFRRVALSIECCYIEVHYAEFRP